MISFKITGNMRTIANSAWISTMDEIKTKSRTDEDVLRVVTFLAKNMHSSPFESVTISCVLDEEVPSFISENNFVRVFDDQRGFVTDLLNFSKIMHKEGFESQIWKEFSKQNKELADVVMLFDFNFKYIPHKYDVCDLFPQISVEIISFHEGDSNSTSRATWRVKCPLSISVQLLRHRSGSFNQVSGRYKTIRQELFEVPNDIKEIINSAHQRGQEFNLEELSHLDKLIDDMSFDMKSSKSKYLKIMKELKRCKTDKVLTNEEYKRMREYARFILPEGRMTELYVSMYMDDFYHYLKLRDSSHAQIEHIALAQLMKKSLKNM
jgi:flavin-dependent thymidylate synthase